MEETVYSLIDTTGGTWRAQAEDGHWALLVPDLMPNIPFARVASNHAALADLEGEADIDGERWLAYRWAEGETLADKLDTGPMERAEGVRLMLRLLDGVAHARLTGCELGQLAADRILVGPDGSPLWAGLLPPGAVGEDVVLGGGQLLFRILTAVLPVTNERGEYPLLTEFVPDLDARLENIVEMALKGRGNGFAHILDLRAALNDYLDELELLGATGAEDSGPVGALMRRMGKTEDFPALSRAVGALNRIAESDNEKLQALAAIILRDFSLSNKILRLANSASYGQFGGEISTISRAVMVLGFNAVKALAMTVVLIEHLTNKEHAGELKDEVVRAFFASLISRKLAERCGYHDIEEGRIAGMFHRLGRLLVLFYLRDDARVIAGVVALGEPEEAVVRGRIGASYEELGMGVARSWNLPDKLIASMAAEDAKPHPPRIDSDWLRLFANAGSGLMTATLADTEPERFKEFLSARDRFSGPMRLTERDLRVAVDESIRDTLRDAAIFGLDAHGGAVLMRLRQLAGVVAAPRREADAVKGGTPPSQAPAGKPTAATTPAMAQSASQATAEPTPVQTSATSAKAASPVKTAAAPMAQAADLVMEDRPQVIDALGNCMQEVTEALVGEFRLNDLLRVILETLFVSLGASRVLLATRSVQRNGVVGRFGFGKNIEDFAARFVVPLDDQNDLFRINLAKNADLLIDDAGKPPHLDVLPSWFRLLNAGRSIILLPIVIDRRVVAALYVDHDEPHKLHLGAREMALLKTLRNQAILAIRQKSPSE
ncbi:MAG: HDOD domain-containing protein [Burkholderiales bacterium]|nr:HDOD domain-containing protein [Burkholderiales bacterium]